MPQKWSRFKNEREKIVSNCQQPINCQLITVVRCHSGQWRLFGNYLWHCHVSNRATLVNATVELDNTLEFFSDIFKRADSIVLCWYSGVVWCATTVMV